MSATKEDTLKRIARYLMLHGSFTPDIGLLRGKMGIAIFFFHYGEYSKNKVYTDFAGELIDEIYREIHVDSPLNFKDGLCGIAWGIDYLIRNKFAEADPDEVLENLDERILEWNVKYIRNYSLEEGLKGIACYIISRCANRQKKNLFIPEEYVIDIIKALELNQSKSNEDITLHRALCEILSSGKTDLLFNPLKILCKKIKFDSKELFLTSQTRPIGIIRNGYAGIGLKIMLEDKVC